MEERYTLSGEVQQDSSKQLIPGHDLSLDRPVVIKVLKDPEKNPDQVAELKREARLTGRLTHPGIVPIHELGENENGEVFYSMKQVSGNRLSTISAKISRGETDDWSLPRLLRIYTRICDTVAYVNEQGVAHRNLTTSSIILGEFGEVLVVDWEHAAETDATEIDVSGLGSMLEEILQLAPHFGRTPPEDLVAVTRKAQTIDPAERYTSASQLREEIETHLAGYATRAGEAGFFKLFGLFLSRHRLATSILTIGFITAVVSMALAWRLNSRQYIEASRDREVAESFMRKAREVDAEKLKNRITLSSGYTAQARQLANERYIQEGLTLARIAAEFDPTRIEANALAAALEFHSGDKDKARAKAQTIPKNKYPNLHYLLNTPSTKLEGELIHTGKSLAYAEVGLSRIAGDISARQEQRLEAYKKILLNAWGDSIDWNLSLWSKIGDRCFSAFVEDGKIGLEPIARKMNQDYLGNVLYLDINLKNKAPDLSILEQIPVESLSINSLEYPLQNEDLAPLRQCRNLKTFRLILYDGADHIEYLSGLDLVGIHIGLSSDTAIDLAPLRDCKTLRSLRIDRSTIASLDPIRDLSLEVYCGPVEDGDLSPLEGMPLKWADLSETDISAVAGAPIGTLFYRKKLTREVWEVMQTLPLKFFSVENPLAIDSKVFSGPLKHLEAMRFRSPYPLENSLDLFPSLKLAKVYHSGFDFRLFSGHPALEEIELRGGAKQQFHLGSLINSPMPDFKRIRRLPNLKGHCFPASLAREMVLQDRNSSLEEIAKLQSRIATSPGLAFAKPYLTEIETALKQGDFTPAGYLSPRQNYQGKSYQMVYSALNRNDAIEFAKSVGGALAGIASRKEFDWAWNTFATEWCPAYWIVDGRGAGSTRAVTAQKSTKGASIIEQQNVFQVMPFLIEWENQK